MIFQTIISWVHYTPLCLSVILSLHYYGFHLIFQPPGIWRFAILVGNFTNYEEWLFDEEPLGLAQVPNLIWGIMALMLSSLWSITPAGSYMFKVNNRNTRTKFEICWKLTINTPERRQELFKENVNGCFCKKSFWRRSGVFIVSLCY